MKNQIKEEDSDRKGCRRCRRRGKGRGKAVSPGQRPLAGWPAVPALAGRPVTAEPRIKAMNPLLLIATFAPCWPRGFPGQAAGPRQADQMDWSQGADAGRGCAWAAQTPRGQRAPKYALIQGGCIPASTRAPLRAPAPPSPASVRSRRYLLRWGVVDVPLLCVPGVPGVPPPLARHWHAAPVEAYGGLTAAHGLADWLANSAELRTQHTAPSLAELHVQAPVERSAS